MGNKALWRKAIGDARLLLLFMTALLFGFNWLFVYLSSLIELGPLGVFLQTLPPAFEKLSGVPFASVATPAGASAAYVDPVVLFATTIWAVGRGSDTVSGEIGRGTMQICWPSRFAACRCWATQGAVTTIGSAILATAVLLGTCTGLATVSLGEHVDWKAFIPGAEFVRDDVLPGRRQHGAFVGGQSSLADNWIGRRLLRRAVGFQSDRALGGTVLLAHISHVRDGWRAASLGDRRRSGVGPVAAIRWGADRHRPCMLRRGCRDLLPSRFTGPAINHFRASIYAGRLG